MRILLILLALLIATPVCTRAQSKESAVDVGKSVLHPRPTGKTKAVGDSSGADFGWLGPAALTLVLAVAGVGSVLIRKTAPRMEPDTLRVVSRTSIAPRHALALVQVGDRIIIVGHGPDGPPVLLGEIDDPDEIDRLTTARGARLNQKSMHTGQVQPNTDLTQTRALIPAPHVAIPKFVGTRKEDA